ncbi:MAG: aminotransferase class V-fold PLP-dependent enzyme [Planctomycetes bacterium]|nr:aminotransferase class V-fold PLP-dependent enzyme [Planctomycetota bacterium]
MLGHEVDLTAARRRIASAYDPQLFAEAGRILVDSLHQHLQSVEHSKARVLNWADPHANVAAAIDLARGGAEFERANSAVSTSGHHTPADPLASRFEELIQTALQKGINLHDPRYVGHQVPAPVPLAGLFDALGAVTNQCMGVYEMGPWATAVERAMVSELGACLGWQEGAYAGIVTHGASLANLTALLVARNVTLGESWEHGLAPAEWSNPDSTGAPVEQFGRDAGMARGKSPKLIVQADAHYCIARSAGILGMGTRNVVKAPLDDRRRLDPRQLETIISELQTAGHPIVAVAACASATPIGAFDPLEPIADICEQHGVWLHVDAAHGGAALLSRRHRHLVAGLERADSFTLDAHKMLFVPALCAFLFYKNRQHSFEAFRQNAPYLFDPSAPDMRDYDSALRTMECTKRAAALGLWGVWALFGPQLFADLVDVTFDLGRAFYEQLRSAPDFVPLHEPECNIVVFRHVPAELQGAPPERLSEFQWQLRRSVIESGEYYLVPTMSGGVAALRCTLINPLTTPEHLAQLLETLRRRGREILAR